MSIQERLADADLLWQHGRREGALLSALIAVSATAQKTFPTVKGDRTKFVAFMKSSNRMTFRVEYRGDLVDLYELFYKQLRCPLVHAAELPVDLRIEDDMCDDPNSFAVRAGGAPEYTVLLSSSWYRFLVNAVLNAPANADIWNTAASS